MNDDDDDVACGMLARARMSHATCGWVAAAADEPN